MINKQTLRSLPEIELPYEYITHKEAPSEFYTAIPYGKKYLAWFTYIGDKNVCLTMEINIRNLSVYNLCKWPELCSFNSELSYGTIFYGTIQINPNKCRNFIIENILYYKGKKIDNVNFVDKLELFNEIFKNDICNTVYIKNQMTFFLPIMHTNKEKFEKMMWNAKYNVYCVQMRALSGETVNVNYINKNKKMIFIARPQIKSDIYELYVENNSNSNSKEEYYGIAYIDSYKTSIMMNNVFRNIKENKDLDKIEESDSEEEFEDISLDKYIIKKEAKILCEYNQILRSWVPIKELV